MTAEPLWTAAEAREALGLPAGDGWEASGVAIDSRAVRPGDLFVAIVGDRLDGHAYVADAFAAGAVAAVVHRQPDGVQADDPRLLTTDDTLAGLRALADAARNRASALIVAVTGSVGKTGTKEMLRLAFGALGSCHASEGNLNNHWGAPLSLARMPRDVAFAVFELGMNHAGEISDLTAQVRPHVAIITRIAAAHTEFFDSIEGIADAKAEIFEGLTTSGVAILNADDPLTERMAPKAAAHPIVRFGEAEEADVRLTGLELGEDGVAVEAQIDGESLRWRLGAPGRHWAQNSLAVIAAVKVLGGDLDAAAAALGAVRPPAGRGERRQVNGFQLIDESYNASPAAVVAAFDTLALAKPLNGGRRVVMLGDMLELGDRSASDHADLAKAFVAAGLDIAHAAGPNARHFLNALPGASRGQWAETADDLAADAETLVGSGDVVLVKGSLGMGMAKVVRALERSDHAV